MSISDRERSLIGKESAPRQAPLAANQVMARHWCEMVEDANPIYFDEAYARQTWLQGTFAPPTMLFTWGMPPIWPEEPDDSPASQLHLGGCTHIIAVSASEEYFLPVRYGDSITVTTCIADISEEKTTRLGTGHFVTTVDTFRNQFGQVVGRHTFTMFRYRPHRTGDQA